MKNFQRFFLTAVFSLISIVSANAQISSVYTNLTQNSCKTIATNEETGGETQKCRGIGKWSLLTLYDDQRMSVNVVAPDQAVAELNFWSVVSSGFSSLGTKAEWRVRKEKNGLVPTALIIRVNTSEGEGVKKSGKSYLAVAKITGTETCVTDKIELQRNANLLARKAADSSAEKPCLQ